MNKFKHVSKLNQEELLRLLGMAVQNAIEYFVINKDKEFMEKIPQLQQAHLQIRELIKIFFAKEISAGPIKKDISQPDLIEWLQGISQAATAVKDYYVMKATTQLIEMIQQGIPILWEHDRFQTLEKGGKLPEKKALTIDEVISKYPGSVRILLNKLVQKLGALQKKPGVTEEFIKEKVKQLYTEVGIQYREILDKINVEDFIRRLLEEAQGMGEVVKK